MEPRTLSNLLSLRKGVSAKLARWAYENLAGEDEALRIYALEAIAVDPTATWARTWLWRELERHKGEPFGDWVVIALTRTQVESAADVMPFVRLYRDSAAHPYTRSSAVFGISNAVGAPARDPNIPRLDENAWTEVRATCQAALCDENPYARAGACWLASNLGGFEDDLRRLAKDRTRLHSGGVVSDYAEDFV